MHELSLAGSILRIVEEAACRERFERVSRLTLEVGALSGVEPQALRFALHATAPGSCLEGAEFVFHQPPGQAWCTHCRASVAIAQHGDACPRCGGWQLQPTGGTELRVTDLLVHDATAARAG